MVEFTVFKGSKEGKIVKSTTARDLKADEILIKTTHSGLCGTDAHFKNKEIVLGHEGAGVIEKIGASVKTFKVGDSVGWGFLHNACGRCKQCLTGHETLCLERAFYSESDLDQGSFASHAIWKADFVFHIPESIPHEYACCLMCGGATVYNALKEVKSTDRVGIIGVGGLGHLAIQFAAKMGCEVIVFSQTDSKKNEAMRLGATEFVATKGAKKLSVSGPIDHLLVTTSQQPDWAQFLPIMAMRGTIYPLSVSKEDLKIPYMPIIMGELRIQGSLVAARNVHIEMLAFAAHHQIKPIIEKFPMTVDGIEESMQRLEDGKMRYRGVLISQ